ncbi:MAG: alpha/beta hydrolase [Sphingomicrobium sp.]
MLGLFPPRLHHLKARSDAGFFFLHDVDGRAMAGRVTLQGPSSHSYFSQRLRLHYADWGNDNAELLLLVHGGRDHCRSWDWVAEQLRDRWHIIAPDLRGHGDSQWSAEGNYPLGNMVYDLAQLVDQFDASKVTIVGHSLGGNIATRFTGLYPDKVRRLVSIEGLGASPAEQARRAAVPMAEHLRQWIADKRAAAGRQPRRYPTLDDAYRRMRDENGYLSEAQARHLTVQGVNRNEDGTWSWKFDPHVHVWPVEDLPQSELEALWGAVTCPTLLLYGADSWASNPQRDGRAAKFPAARVVEYEKAGHWLHHDQLARFMADLHLFL